MGRVADFVTEIYSRNSPMYGGFSADPHTVNDKMVGVKVTKKIGNSKISRIVSNIEIEYIRMSPEAFAQKVIKEMNDTWAREVRKVDA